VVAAVNAPADFKHSKVARERRAAKARVLRLAMIELGLEVTEAETLLEDHPATKAMRLEVRRLARLDRDPSMETWQAAVAELRRRPARLLAEVGPDGKAPCGCTPDPQTGVLYESLPKLDCGYVFRGWPCSHYEEPPAAPGDVGTPRMCGPKPPTEQDLVVVNEFVDVLADRHALEHANDDPDRPEPEDVADPDEPSWWD
jgi:hypothetical protein